MRQLVLAVVVSIALSVASTASAGASGSRISITHDAARGVVTASATFAPVKIAKQRDGLLDVSIEGLPNTVEAGLPSVPVKTFVLALPRGKKVASLRVDEGDREVLTGKIRPSRSMLPYSWRRQGRSALPDQVSPRLETDRYPSDRVRCRVQVLHHVPVAIVNVHPVVVFPGTGSFSFERATRISIAYADDPAAARHRELLPHELRRVQSLVDNPGILDKTRTRAEVPEGYDYLIVSSGPLIGYTGPASLESLVDHLKSRELRARVVDVATIGSTTRGNDLADKIRNFIRAEYEQRGIEFVLLAGDGDASGAGAAIPARRFWAKVRAFDGSWHTIEEKIPADLYYSCLDGDFDGNGNGLWGEPTDGAGGADVDLLAEVCIGRMPMKTTTELQNFVRKTVAVASRAQPKSVLLMGEELFAQLNLYGDDYMDQLVGTCTDHAYETRGYGTDWAVDRLYDRTDGWSGSKALARINDGGFAMVNHLGHSNTGYNMRLWNSQIKKFTNPRPFFYYTQGCFPGNFTVNDCFVELLVRHEKGAVAAVANTSYGLGPEDPDPSTTQTPGASQMLHRRFIDAVFAQGVDSLGRANQRSKEAFVGLSTAQEIRWVFWDATYFGDPSLRPAY